MKLLITLLIAYSFTFSQSQEEYLDYFPMHIGDIWTYHLIEYDYHNDDTLDTSYLTFEIIGDTVLEDGFKYFVYTYDEVYKHKSFARIDTSNLIVYDGYFGDYKLDASPDSIYLDQSEQQTWVFADTSFVGNLEIIRPAKIYKKGIYVFNRTLSKGFGLSYSETGDLGMHQRRYLVYAKIDGIEHGAPVKVEKENREIINDFTLFQNYPNPFNPSTNINYSVKHSAIIKLSVYDLLGNKIATLVDEHQSTGKYSVKFKSDKLVSGIYFYRLESDKTSNTRKMIIIK